jgi:hypothetical protein
VNARGSFAGTGLLLISDGTNDYDSYEAAEAARNSASSGGKKPEDEDGNGRDTSSLNDIIDNIRTRIPNEELMAPSKRGDPPLHIKTNKPVEIHHVNQNARGPFDEMNWVTLEVGVTMVIIIQIVIPR